MTTYYEVSSPKGTVKLLPSDTNLANFLSNVNNVKDITLRSDDGSFTLTTRGCMIDSCSDLKRLEKLRSLIVRAQLVQGKQLIKYYKEDTPEQGRKR